MNNIETARNRIPERERGSVTDQELKLADQISDEEFRQRIAMPELIGKPPRMERGRV